MDPDGLFLDRVGIDLAKRCDEREREGERERTYFTPLHFLDRLRDGVFLFLAQVLRQLRRS